MKPEPKTMAAIMTAISAYIQLEKQASSVSTDAGTNPPANQSSTKA